MFWFDVSVCVIFHFWQYRINADFYTPCAGTRVYSLARGEAIGAMVLWFARWAYYCVMFCFCMPSRNRGYAGLAQDGYDR